MKKQSIEHTQLLILSLLASRDMYGYEMIVELSRRSQNVFEMKEGTLYPVLHALEAERFLESYWEEVDGRKRKYYRITKKGSKRLAEQTEEWQVFSNAVGRVLGASAR